jgi:hypothetical protein
MSLKFLAVGQSFAGLRGDKSPYALRKENQLPKFGSSPRFAGKGVPEERLMVQTDFLEERRSAPEAEVLTEELKKAEAPLFPPAPVVVEPERPKRGWLSFFRMRWFRTQKSREELVQSELSLEKVRVLRNDLADADLQLVLKRKKKARPVFNATQSNNGLPRQGWSELTARLFELGQK